MSTAMTTSRASPATLKNISTRRYSAPPPLQPPSSRSHPRPQAAHVPRLPDLRKTAHERICISVLVPDGRSGADKSVRQLAAIALTVARNSTRDALWRTTVLLGSGGASPTLTPVERGRLAQCRALYAECLRETTRTIALVTAASYDAAVRASSTLHWYPDKCQSLLYMQSSESAMEQTIKQVEEKLIASTDIVHLLLQC